jgi:hypothetical protein
VTAFSRVQKFLEFHRVINVDAMRRCDLTRIAIKQNSINSTPNKRGRKPKRSYVDNQMAKLGVTADEVMEECVKLPSRTRPNPFKLVPLETYDSESEVTLNEINELYLFINLKL